MKKKEQIIIRVAEKKDYKKIINFLKLHWNSNHIFIRNELFFKYELFNYFPQFILAIKKKSIVGLVGFYHYEKNFSKSDLFLVLLRVLEEYSNYQIAAKLVLFIKKITSKKIHTIGATKETLPLYKLLKFNTGWLDHYFWANSNLKFFKICKVNKRKINSFSKSNYSLNGFNFQEINNKFNKKNYTSIVKNNNVRKSYWYFKKRYIKNPIYNYEVYILKNKDNVSKGLGVVRIVDLKDGKCIRIIDWIGNLVYFNYFCKFTINLAIKINAEFVDLYCSGISSKNITKSGFKKVTINEVIPNHLSPIEYKNISISYVSNDDKNLVFFRGDCDQDRPN